jgi:hypothetical protein
LPMGAHISVVRAGIENPAASIETVWRQDSPGTFCCASVAALGRRQAMADRTTLLYDFMVEPSL